MLLAIFFSIHLQVENGSLKDSRLFKSEQVNLLKLVIIIIIITLIISLWVQLGLWVLPAVPFYPYYMSYILIRLSQKEL